MKRLGLLIFCFQYALVGLSQVDSTPWEVEIISPIPILETTGFLAENPDLWSKIDSLNALIYTEADSAMLLEFELDEEIWKEYLASQRSVFAQSRLPYDQLLEFIRGLLTQRIYYLELYYKFIIHRGWH